MTRPGESVSAVETSLIDYPNFSDFSYIEHYSSNYDPALETSVSAFYAGNHSRSSSSTFEAGPYHPDSSHAPHQQNSSQYQSSGNGNLKDFQDSLTGNLSLVHDPSLTTAGMGSMASGDISNWLQPRSPHASNGELQQPSMSSIQYDSQTGMNSSITTLSSWDTFHDKDSVQVRDNRTHSVQQQRQQTLKSGWGLMQPPSRNMIPTSPASSIVMGDFSQGYHPIRCQSNQQPNLQEEMKSFSTSHSDNSLSVASTEGGENQRGEHRRKMSISSSLEASQLSAMTPIQHQNEPLKQSEGDILVPLASMDYPGQSTLSGRGRKSSPQQIPVRQAKQLCTELGQAHTGSWDGSHAAESAILSSSPSRGGFHNSPLPDFASSPKHVGTAHSIAQQPVVPQVAAEDDDNQQDRGLLLVNLLVGCADAVASNQQGQAMSLLSELSQLVNPHGDSIQRVASYFTYGLLAHIANHGSGSAISRPLQIKEPTAADTLDALQVFSMVCPFMRFGDVTAIQTVLEAFEREQDIHWIDLGMVPGSLWLPCNLLQALAARKGGPPKMIHFTGVQVNVSTTDDQTGRKLKEFADKLNLNFIFQPVSIERLEHLMPWMLTNRAGQAVTVNCSLKLHTLLYDDGSCLHHVLDIIHNLSPKVFCFLEQEATHNAPTFLARFLEALHFYSAVFDSLEASLTRVSQERAKLEQLLLGQAIINIVACEGKDRVERHERLQHWRRRMAKAGYLQRPLSEAAVVQAKSLPSIASGTGFSVVEDQGSLILNWQERPLFTSSAWCCYAGMPDQSR